MRMITPSILAAAAALMLVPSLAAEAAAPTYKDRLKEDITMVMAPSEPSIPDDVETEFWRCIASSFVEVKVSLPDLAKLDKLSAANWNPKDALVRKYGDQLMSAMKNPSGSDWSDIMSFAESLECPETVQSYFEAYKG